MPRKRSMKRHSVTQPDDKSIRLIPLTQGQNAIVDATDFEWLSNWNWTAWWNPETECFYAVRNEKHKMIKMHRQILDAQAGDIVDHKNTNSLCNQRDNLRKCTKSQNGCNRGKASHNTSGLKGVSWEKSRNKWQAHVTFNGKNHFLGRFNSKEEAAATYDETAKRLHGEFARTNHELMPRTRA